MIGILAAFAKIGDAMEIDPACLLGDTSSVRIVDRATNDQFLGNPRKGANNKVLGSKYKIEVLRIWPRAENVDEIGYLRPFFPRLPGPGNGGWRDDWG